MEPFIENISEVPPAAFFKWKLGQFVFQVDGLNFFPSINCLTNSFLVARALDGGCESLWRRKNRLLQMFHIQLFQMEN